jgi:hypothetical protein
MKANIILPQEILKKGFILVYHVVDQIGPLGGEVFLADDGDGRAQLLLHGRRRLEHLEPIL